MLINAVHFLKKYGRYLSEDMVLKVLKKPDSLNDYLKTIKELEGQVYDLRKSLTAYQSKGNVAIAKYDIDGDFNYLQAHSHTDKIGDSPEAGRFVHLKDSKDRIFDYRTFYKRDGTTYTREFDTEAKILENIASRYYKNRREVSGYIKLYTERAACESCSDIILAFREMFPNIKLDIYTRDILLFTELPPPG